MCRCDGVDPDARPYRRESYLRQTNVLKPRGRVKKVPLPHLNEPCRKAEFETLSERTAFEVIEICPCSASDYRDAGENALDKFSNSGGAVHADKHRGSVLDQGFASQSCESQIRCRLAANYGTGSPSTHKPSRHGRTGGRRTQPFDERPRTLALDVRSGNPVVAGGTKQGIVKSFTIGSLLAIWENGFRRAPE